MAKKKIENELPEKSSSKNNLTGFLEKFFELNLIPSTGLELKFNNKKFFLEKDEVADIILILVNAYNRYANSNSKLKLDRDELIKSKLFHLVEAKIRILKENGDPKHLESLIRQYLNLKKRDFKMTTDLKVFEKCMKELKPDITFDEIYSLIKKHSKEDE